MIKANELRIGNLVLSDGCEVEVTDLSNTGPNEIETTANFEGSCNGIITPIPITEEWLVKLGFTISDRLATIVLDMSGKEIIGFQIKHHYDNLWYINHDHNFHNGCQFIHQLQNLCFAFTGEELNLK